MAEGTDPAVLKGRRVLIVEDETLITMLYEDILADLECEVVGPALNLRQALDLARSETMDAAILDLNLAGESSLPAAEVLRARGVPVVFSSGYGATGLSPAWDGLPTLPKPFTADELAAALAAAVRG